MRELDVIDVVVHELLFMVLLRDMGVMGSFTESIGVCVCGFLDRCVCVSMCLSVCLFACVSVCLCVCLSGCVSVCLCF